MISKTKKTQYQDVKKWDQLNQLQAVDDFLPKPKDLIFQPKLQKVTLSLSVESIEFFKEQATNLNGSYQPMIRNLLDAYTKKMKYG
jgi:predicted DNA binding CopG/RHH family protein